MAGNLGVVCVVTAVTVSAWGVMGVNGRLRGRLLAGVGVGLLVAGCGVGSHAAAPGAHTPTPSRPPAQGDRAVVYGLRMLSPMDGWGEVAPSLDGRSVLARTADGGAKWHPVSLPGPCRDATGLPGGTSLADAWVSSSTDVGASGRTRVTVCNSADAGRHWIAVARFGATGTAGSPQFVDARHGWLTTVLAGGMHGNSDVHLFRTVDGGRHWTQVAAWVSGIAGGHSFGGLPAMCGGQFQFVTPTTAWYEGGCPQGGGVGEGSHATWAGYLAVTRDGGARWHAVDLPHPRAGHGRAGCLAGAAFYLAPMTVTARVVELYAGGPGASASVIYRSAGGRSWAVEPLPLPTSAVGSFDGVHLLQLSDTAPRVYASDDAGRSWHQLDSNLPRLSFDGPYFADPSTAFTFLTNGRPLYRTSDGGRTWEHVPVTLAGA
jgi:photosystem II stability/assembly factor-like uncharacterized protein